MDGDDLHRKVLLDLMAAPSVLLTAAAGVTAMLAGWAVELPVLIFGGAIGVLASVGALATRWLFKRDKLVEKAMKQMQEKLVRDRSAELDGLEQRLQNDDDPRSEQLLRDLRTVYDQLKQPEQWRSAEGKQPPIEIIAKADTLFRSCIVSLERSLTMWETAQQMHTDDLKQEMLDGRQKTLDEVQQSVSQLARTFDQLKALTVEPDRKSRLSEIRNELDQSLTVARNIEDRMKSFERDIESRVSRKVELN